MKTTSAKENNTQKKQYWGIVQDCFVKCDGYRTHCLRLVHVSSKPVTSSENLAIKKLKKNYAKVKLTRDLYIIYNREMKEFWPNAPFMKGEFVMLNNYRGWGELKKGIDLWNKTDSRSMRKSALLTGSCYAEVIKNNLRKFKFDYSNSYFRLK